MFQNNRLPSVPRNVYGSNKIKAWQNDRQRTVKNDPFVEHCFAGAKEIAILQ